MRLNRDLEMAPSLETTTSFAMLAEAISKDPTRLKQETFLRSKKVMRYDR
jgi:hypothetical protein